MFNFKKNNELKNLIERSEVEAIFYSKKYEKVLKDNKYSAYGYLNLYNCMTPEAQAKNSAYIDRIITLAKNSDDKYSIEK